MVPHQWPVALAVIWHIYSSLACSLEDSDRDLSSSGKVVLGQGQVPCEFWADQPNFIFQPTARERIQHIYCGRVEGMDLSSSGDVALTRGLTGDLPQSKGHLPWRWQVVGTIPH